MPASCVFWSYGHTDTFTTVPEDHGNCSVGRFTHGIAPAEAILDKQDVGTLLDVGWVTTEAFGGVAAKSSAPAAITYGPLGASEVEPDVVLLRISPRQLMEITDANNPKQRIWPTRVMTRDTERAPTNRPRKYALMTRPVTVAPNASRSIRMPNSVLNNALAMIIRA